MTQRSRFFDSSGGDRVYTSDAWAQVLSAMQSTGVVPGIGSELQVHASSPAAMSVRVNLGVAFILGYYFEVYSAEDTLTITAANATNPRIDRIVARRSLTNRTASLVVLTGTPAVSPTPPALSVNTAGDYDIPLAQVYVAANATSIVDGNITDERGVRSAGFDVAALLNATTGHKHSGAAGDAPAIPWGNVSSKPSTFAPADHLHDATGHGGTIAWSVITGKPTAFAPTDHAHTASGDGGTVAWSAITSKPSTFAPSAHAASHANGAADEIAIDWTQITTGKPATFTPTDHTHLGAGTGGAIPWANITSKPSTFAPSAHASSHNNGGSDEISIDWSQIATGKPATWAPSSHAISSHTGSAADINGWVRASAGGGSAGDQVWVGTTDPGASASEGDIWIKG